MPRRSRSVSLPEKRACSRGFTLIEMIMVIVIGGIIAVIGAQMLSSTLSAYFTGRDAVVRDWNARIALERMSRELRAVRSATASDLNINPSQLGFIDTDGNAICYYLSGTTLMRSADVACSSAGAQPLADGIGNLSFGYFDQNGAATASPASVSYITVTFTATQNNLSATLHTTVSPRNF